jgi:hypothetical protein
VYRRPHRKKKKPKLIGHMLRRSCLPKHVIEEKTGQEGEEEDVSSYWMV